MNFIVKSKKKRFDSNFRSTYSTIFASHEQQTETLPIVEPLLCTQSFDKRLPSTGHSETPKPRMNSTSSHKILIINQRYFEECHRK